MRSYQYKILAWLRYALSVCLAIGVLAFVALFHITVFPYAADKEYYLYSPSSQAQIKNEITFSELPYIKGECARFAIENDEKDLQALIAHYNAEIVRIEQFNGGTSYYCYSNKLKTPILLDGAHVNLHIVVKENELLIATPLVFGGY